MNQAVIDIGTNSARLLIYRVENGEVKRVYKTVRYTRMGEKVNQTGKICEAAMTRNEQALTEFQSIMFNYGVKDARVFGTSAMRDASNSQDFIDRIRQRLNMNIEVISGDREALYGYLGVAKSFDEPVLIFDIGGGSTELITGCGNEMQHMVSLNMGCVRGTEKYLKHEIPERDELAVLAIDMDLRLNQILPSFGNLFGKKIVGIGGTATTLAAMDQEMAEYDGDRIHKSVVTKEKLDQMIGKMSVMTLEERKNIIGLDEKRADIILAGSIILDRILTAVDSDSFTVCDYDNLEGAVYAAMIESSENNQSGCL